MTYVRTHKTSYDIYDGYQMFLEPLDRDADRHKTQTIYVIYIFYLYMRGDQKVMKLVADLFLFCYERDFMTSLSDVKQAEIIQAFKSTSRYLDDLLNIDNLYFEGIDNRIYPPELQLNKANTSDTEAPFLDLHLSISNGFVSSKIMISAMILILI